MQASVAAEIRWRLDLYAEVLGLCARGGLPLARFLALVPDRLRLAHGDRAERVRVKVGVTPELRRELRATLPPASPEDSGAPLDRAARRRFIRLAQTHPDVPVLALKAWLPTGGARLVHILSRAYQRGLDEVGRGEGGLEAAYLVHLALLDATRAALDGAAAGPGARAVLAELLPQAFALAAEASRANVDALPARLGLQTATGTSLETLGAPLADWERRLVNPRRTVSAAVRLARRVVAPPFEGLPVERVVDTVARRLLAEASVATTLGVELLAEQVRDGCLLLVAELPAAQCALAAEVASSEAELRRALFNHRRRDELARWLRTGPAREHRAAQALVGRVQGAERVVAGDLGPLGVHGDVPARAALAARGAVLGVLDAYVAGLLPELRAVIEPVPPEALPTVYAAGRGYRLGLDAEPLYRLPDLEREAALVVDLSRVTESLQSKPARRAAGLLERHLIGPLLDRVDSTPGATVAGQSAERVALRGPIDSLVELAQDYLQHLAQLREAARLGPSPALGGGGDPDPGAPEGLYFEVGLALDYGERAEALPCAPGVAVSRPLTAAARLVTSSATVTEARRRRLRGVQQSLAEGDVRLAFSVSAGAREGLYGLHNEGCVVTEAARVALEAAAPGAVVRELMLSSDALSEDLRRGYLLEEEPERLRVTRGSDGRVRAALRYIVDASSGPLWELLPPRHPLLGALSSRGEDG